MDNLKNWEKFNEFFWNKKKTDQSDVNSDVEKMKRDIDEDDLKNAGYYIFKKSGTKNSLHLMSDNKKYFVMINPKNDKGYDFFVGDPDDPMYRQSTIAEDTFGSLTEIVDFLETEYNGKGTPEPKSNGPGW